MMTTWKASAIAVVICMRSAAAVQAGDCHTCSGGASTLTITAVNPQRCSSETDNCDSTDCTNSDDLTACPAIALVGGTCVNREIRVCDCWADATTLTCVTACSWCEAVTLSAGGGTNLTSRTCVNPGPGTYKFLIFANDVTGIGCNPCSAGCNSSCHPSDGCDNILTWVGCPITIPV